MSSAGNPDNIGSPNAARDITKPKNMHIGKQYFEKYAELYNNIEDREYRKKFEKLHSKR